MVPIDKYREFVSKEVQKNYKKTSNVDVEKVRLEHASIAVGLG